MFDNYFEVFLADTQESKEINYSIRYQVYCEEMGFENKDNFPLEQEFDAYDNHSSHFIIRHKRSGQWVGAMRLIFKAEKLLPIEQHCLLNEKINKCDVAKSVELSRLCLIQEIRRRCNDIDPPHGITDDRNEIKETDKIKLFNNSRINRSIIWGLIYAASKYSYRNNIPNWYFLTTHSLEKVLRKGGLNMLSIGDPCHHKGVRHPFKMNAFDTYQSEIWKDDYKNGYRKFSDLNLIEKYIAA
jgi:N-acyl amino acid synthase of PEP-CTERM/exosortase system